MISSLQFLKRSLHPSLVPCTVRSSFGRQILHWLYIYIILINLLCTLRFLTYEGLERLSMTFIFPANGKNSTSAVCRLEMNSFVFVVNVGFFPYFYEGSILEFDKKVTK